MSGFTCGESSISVVNRTLPLVGDLLLNPIQQLQQGLITREGALRLVHLTELTMEALDDVRRVDDAADLRGIGEIARGTGRRIRRPGSGTARV